MQKTTIIHKYAVAPLLAIAAMHAAVWLGSKNLADFSRAFDVTLGLDALIPIRLLRQPDRELPAKPSQRNG